MTTTFTYQSLPLTLSPSVRMTLERVGRCGPFARCNNIWLCQRCAIRELSRRRREARKRIAAHKGPLVFATFTVPHDPNEPLSVVLERLIQARRRLKRGGSWHRMAASAGLIGSVHVLEITHDPQSGWAPHYHEIFLIKRGVTAFRTALYSRFTQWGRAHVESVRRGAEHTSRVINYIFKGSKSQMKALGRFDVAAIIDAASAGDPASLALVYEMASSLWGVHRTSVRLSRVGKIQ